MKINILELYWLGTVFLHKTVENGQMSMKRLSAFYCKAKEMCHKRVPETIKAVLPNCPQ